MEQMVRASKKREFDMDALARQFPDQIKSSNQISIPLSKSRVSVSIGESGASIPANITVANAKTMVDKINANLKAGKPLVINIESVA